MDGNGKNCGLSLGGRSAHIFFEDTSVKWVGDSKVLLASVRAEVMVVCCGISLRLNVLCNLSPEKVFS